MNVYMEDGKVVIELEAGQAETFTKAISTVREDDVPAEAFQLLTDMAEQVDDLLDPEDESEDDESEDEDEEDEQ